MEGSPEALQLGEAARLACRLQELLGQELHRPLKDRDQQLPASQVHATAAALLSLELGLSEGRLQELRSPAAPQADGRPDQGAGAAEPGGSSGGADAELERLERQLELAAAKCAELERHKAAAHAEAAEAAASGAPPAALAAAQATATRAAILAQKASIERQELQLRVLRLKRSHSSAREGVGGGAPAAAAPALDAVLEAAAGSSAAAGQQVQEEEGMAAGSPLAAVHGRLDQPEQAECHLHALAAASQRLELTWQRGQDQWWAWQRELAQAPSSQLQVCLPQTQRTQQEEQQIAELQQWRTCVALFLEAAGIALLLHFWRTGSGGTASQQQEAAERAATPGFGSCAEPGDAGIAAVRFWFPGANSNGTQLGGAASAAAEGEEEEEEGWAPSRQQQQKQKKQKQKKQPQQQQQKKQKQPAAGTEVRAPRQLSAIQTAAMQTLQAYALPWHQRQERMAEARWGGQRQRQAVGQPGWQQQPHQWQPQQEGHAEEVEGEERQQPPPPPPQQQQRAHLTQQERQATTQQATKRAKQILKERRQQKRKAAAAGEQQQQQQQRAPKRRLQQVAADMQQRWVPASNEQSLVPAQPAAVEVHPAPAPPAAAAAMPAAAAAQMAPDPQPPRWEGRQSGAAAEEPLGAAPAGSGSDGGAGDTQHPHHQQQEQQHHHHHHHQQQPQQQGASQEQHQQSLPPPPPPQQQQQDDDIVQQTRQLEALLTEAIQLDPALQEQLAALLGQLEHYALMQQAGAEGGQPEQQAGAGSVQPEQQAGAEGGQPEQQAGAGSAQPEQQAGAEGGQPEQQAAQLEGSQPGGAPAAAGGPQQQQQQQQQQQPGDARMAAPRGRPAALAIPASNVGFQLLLKAGWSEGSGLGARRQGRLEPLQPAATKGRGLGFLPSAAAAGQEQQAQQGQQANGQQAKRAKAQQAQQAKQAKQAQLAKPLTKKQRQRQAEQAAKQQAKKAAKQAKSKKARLQEQKDLKRLKELMAEMS